MPRTLDRRTLNRTTLHRQLLLERSGMAAQEAVERLVAVQAQEPNAPYVGLWNRLEGFHQDVLTGLLHERAIVRSSLLRGTQHMAATPDFHWLKPLLQPIALRAWRAGFGRVAAGWDLDELAAAARGVLAGRTLTRPELARVLAERWPDRDPAALRWSLQALVSVVHPPPSGTWNTFGAMRLALPEDWTGEPLRERGADELVTRYLAAFGPASARDFAVWSGLRRKDVDFERLRPELRVYRDENGVELFDVPDGELVEDAAAPVRFLPEFDNLVLAYADRTRVMADERRKVVCVGSDTKPTLLVDGRVHAVWSLRNDKKEGRATLTIKTFEPLPAGPAVEEEAARLLGFAAPGSAHEVRVVPA
ncbi:winged helix DNA-binding domain-containing protein [Actinomadura rifamycini]|uniref:winged helix DNA-binding domain-containing protein n=1 Tax=Actinomadura rifamycini TaxID=31962 RepID=UPI00042172D8|nr:winged helix DNA-binding domain-containing protein [Actinomadura rifamycini]